MVCSQYQHKPHDPFFGHQWTLVITFLLMHAEDTWSLTGKNKRVFFSLSMSFSMTKVTHYCWRQRCIQKKTTLKSTRKILRTNFLSQLRCRSRGSVLNRCRKSKREKQQFFFQHWKVFLPSTVKQRLFRRPTCSSAMPMKMPATTVRLSWSHFSNWGTQPLMWM